LLLKIGGISMPLISRFFRVSIKMYFNDHGLPHFHAQYQDLKGIFSINSGRLVSGSLPPSIVEVVTKWATNNKTVLMENWKRARSNQQLLWVEGVSR
jgi:Domain of unknown function (DUF4160)